MSYTKTNWHDGDTITAVKMNKIENGIESSLSDALVTLGKALCGDSFEVESGSTDAEIILEIANNYEGGSSGLDVYVFDTKNELVIDESYTSHGQGNYDDVGLPYVELKVGDTVFMDGASCKVTLDNSNRLFFSSSTSHHCYIDPETGHIMVGAYTSGPDRIVVERITMPDPAEVYANIHKLFLAFPVETPYVASIIKPFNDPDMSESTGHEIWVIPNPDPYSYTPIGILDATDMVWSEG